MPSSAARSQAYVEYLENRKEVLELLRQVPDDGLHITRKQRILANALLRGIVVLLSSHLERYVESLAIEAVDAINQAALPIASIPEHLKSIQVDHLIRAAHEANNWTKKAGKLTTITGDHAWLWDTAKSGTLSGEALINGFDNPLPSRIVKLFASFNIYEVVGKAVARNKQAGRALIQIKVKELVEKRNSIAHTGMTTDLTITDVRDYLVCSRRLVRGLDDVVRDEIVGLIGTDPWSPQPAGQEPTEIAIVEGAKRGIHPSRLVTQYY